jgi:rhamnosyltransferase
MNQNEIIAVVVSFNGGLKTIAAVKKLSNLLPRVLVVDNGSFREDIELIVALENDNIVLIELGNNYGIGYALNIGVEYAVRNGYKWLVTMDQDSIVDDDFIWSFIKFQRENQAVISMVPNIKLNINDKYRSKNEEVEYAITSGHVVSVSIFDRVGYYNESLFIDGVDFDFCLRLGQHKIKTYCVFEAQMKHELGVPHKKKSLIARFYSDHSPLRRYYIYRNFVYLVRQYWSTNPVFIVKFLVAHIMLFLAIILYEKKIKASVKAIYYGLCDGLRGRYGKSERLSFC